MSLIKRSTILSSFSKPDAPGRCTLLAAPRGTQTASLNNHEITLPPAALPGAKLLKKFDQNFFFISPHSLPTPWGTQTAILKYY